jgi:formamidopyrimidine-DNA glycosylase
MSVEAAEAKILANQLEETLVGKKIMKADLKDYERLQRIGFINKELTDYNNLLNGVVESVKFRGNSVLVKLDNSWNLLIGPEYGGRIRHHKPGEEVEDYHLRVDFNDNSVLSIRLTNMGVVQAAHEENLKNLYVYARDFSETPSPLDKEFTYDYFKQTIKPKNRMLKQTLVGKEAVIVGVSNSAYQDLLYRARIHPKRRGSSLSEEEMKALYSALVELMKERTEKGGKTTFTDIHGKQGGYEPQMGPNMKDNTCPACGSQIEKISHGGGSVYLCPECQK